jgi:pantoate--beta-alanine ligase
VAVFGEKDYQQLQVIRRMVRDLDMPVEILGAPTSRLEDGLARSSRNTYLTEAERPVAPALNRALRDAAERLRGGGRVDEAEAAGLAALAAAGFGRVDYFEVRGAEDLARLGPGPVSGAARVFAAAFLGRTRLIDNLAV